MIFFDFFFNLYIYSNPFPVITTSSSFKFQIVVLALFFQGVSVQGV